MISVSSRSSTLNWSRMIAEFVREGSQIPMKMLYCWRCESEVPMLDEAKFEIIRELFSVCIQSIQDHRKKEKTDLKSVPINYYFLPVRQAYEAMTGWADMHHNAIWHHRISLYGPPCRESGRPLRTPRARYCPACGTLAEGVRAEDFV